MSLVRKSSMGLRGLLVPRRHQLLHKSPSAGPVVLQLARSQQPRARRFPLSRPRTLARDPFLPDPTSASTASPGRRHQPPTRRAGRPAGPGQPPGRTRTPAHATHTTRLRVRRARPGTPAPCAGSLEPPGPAAFPHETTGTPSAGDALHTRPLSQIHPISVETRTHVRSPSLTNP